MPKPIRTVPPRLIQGNDRAKREPIQSAAERVDTDGLFDERIQMLVYGRAGTGKTTFWSSFPAPIRAILCSGGNKSGELKSVAVEDRESIKPVRLRSSAEMAEVLDSLKKNDQGYQTVILDHASGFQDLVLKELLGLEKIPLQKSWGLATREQYGQCTVKCKEFFTELLDLPMNVVIVAHERGFGGEGSEDLIVPSIGASLMPQLANWLNGATNNICHCFLRRGWEERRVQGPGGKVKVKKTRTGPIEFCLRTGRDDVYVTRLRVPRGTELPDVIVDPTYVKILALLNGGGNVTE